MNSVAPSCALEQTDIWRVGMKRGVSAGIAARGTARRQAFTRTASAVVGLVVLDGLRCWLRVLVPLFVVGLPFSVCFSPAAKIPPLTVMRTLGRSGENESGRGSCLCLSSGGAEPEDEKIIKGGGLNDGDLFLLPLFPLRKSVRTPNEYLTLNLFEDRYVTMAEHVVRGGHACELADNSERNPSFGPRCGQRLFGALYCSDKPQIVKGGLGPITPLIEEGDIGAVCDILYSEEGMVPIEVGSTQLRRRIKLVSLAVGRFRVERIICNGFDGGSEGGYNLPFILIEASRVEDTEPKFGSREEQYLRELEQKLHNKWVKQKHPGAAMDLSWNVTAFDYVPPSPLDSASGTQLSELAVRAMNDWEEGPCCHDDDIQTVARRQYFSFAMILELLPEISPEDVLVCMKARSTYERLEYVSCCIENNRPWYAGLFGSS